jgi:hypothetical protein
MGLSLLGTDQLARSHSKKGRSNSKSSIHDESQEVKGVLDLTSLGRSRSYMSSRAALWLQQGRLPFLMRGQELSELELNMTGPSDRRER